jgi:hypothetical protein
MLEDERGGSTALLLDCEAHIVKISRSVNMQANLLRWPISFLRFEVRRVGNHARRHAPPCTI